jgi:hypothetical protein
MKRVLLFVSIVVGGVIVVGICVVLALAMWPCCALQPEVRLDVATLHADGTLHIVVSTTVDDLQELHAFDVQGNLIATIPTAFEKQVNTYYWETTIPATAQQIVLLMAQPLPAGLIVEANVPDWQALDVTNTIGFVRTLTVRLEPVDWSNPRAATVQLTSTEDVFAQLHLYDAMKRQVDSLESSFTWDDEAKRFIWEITIADDVTQMELHPRNPIEMRIDIQSVTSGWLQANTGIGFVRGELPLLLLDSAIVLDDGRTTLRFVASEPVFDQMYVTKRDDSIIATYLPVFVQAGDINGLVWQVTIPNDAERVVFVPVESESRSIVVDSNVSVWKNITVGSDIGFIRVP